MSSSDRTFALKVRKIGSLLRKLEQLEERATPALSTWWGDLGIGQPATVGATAATATSAVVQGGGLGYSTNSDQFHFRFKELTGDGTISAKIGAITDVDTNATGGLMMRNGVVADAPFAAVSRTAVGGWTFQYRAAPSGAVMSVTYAGPSAQFAKLVRNGTLFSGYVSPNGQDGTWSLVGTGAIAAANTIDVGLAVTSFSTGTLASASFENLTLADPPPIGAGLEGVIDWAYSNAFVDMTKQARQFMTAEGFQPVAVDANGWPTADNLMIFQSGGANTAHIYNGTYKLSFKGQATIDKWVTPGSVTNVVYNSATNTTTADVTLSASESQEFYLGIVFRNSKRTPTSAAGSGVTDVKLIRPGYGPAGTQVFTNEFTNHLKRFSTLRFMDWLETNNSNVVNWADRTKVTAARQTITGVAWEYIVQLANHLGKDLWINVPAKATDDYVRNLASFLKATVNPDRAIYVEYSNEVWNWGFQQTSYNYNQAIAEVNAGHSPLNADGETNQGYWAWRRVGAQTKRISDIFRSVWGDAAINSRIRCVLAGQAANPETYRQGLKLIRNTWGDPSQFIYGIAGAPYFSLGSLDNGTNLTTEQVIAGLQAAMLNTPAVMTYAQSVAIAYGNGLKFLAYEGGPDTFGGNNIQAKKASQLDPRMAGIVTTYLTQWFESGGSLFNWFVAGATNYDSPYGTWGLTNDITNPNTPKTLGIDALLRASLPTFRNGLALPAEFSAKAVVGTTGQTGNRYAGAGDQLQYLLSAPGDGSYTFRIKYAGDQIGRSLRISVNGKVVQTLNLTPTATWDTFVDSALVTIQLTGGQNMLQIDVLGGGLQLGNIKISTAATRTTLSANGSTFTATVKGLDSNLPGGLVRFYDGATLIGSANLDSTGKATFSATSLGAGNHIITATYAGNIIYSASNSTGVSLAGSGSSTTTAPVITPPKVNSVIIDNGSAQRSMIRNIKVIFDRIVTLLSGAFELSLNNGVAPSINVAVGSENSKTTATLTFSGFNVLGGSLPDGLYALRIVAAKVADAANPGVTMATERVENFYRLFGDADGDRDVDAKDYDAFRSAYFTTTNLSAFNADGDGDVDQLDYRQFAMRYGKVI